jgi:hypothetical protein
MNDLVPSMGSRIQHGAIAAFAEFLAGSRVGALTREELADGSSALRSAMVTGVVGFQLTAVGVVERDHFICTTAAAGRLQQLGKLAHSAASPRRYCAVSESRSSSTRRSSALRPQACHRAVQATGADDRCVTAGFANTRRRPSGRAMPASFAIGEAARRSEHRLVPVAVPVAFSGSTESGASPPRTGVLVVLAAERPPAMGLYDHADAFFAQRGVVHVRSRKRRLQRLHRISERKASLPDGAGDRNEEVGQPT